MSAPDAQHKDQLQDLKFADQKDQVLLSAALTGAYEGSTDPWG